MLKENDYNNIRTGRSMYEQYLNNEGKRSGNNGQFEKKSVFCSDFSTYHINDNTVEPGKACQWDTVNCSGVPMEQNSEKGVVYVDGSESHTLLIGATGSKKSRLVVMPTVFTIGSVGENMIICDPKGEVYRRTSGFLQNQGYHIHVINLREPEYGDGWNMLTVPYNLYCSGNIDKACEFINDMTINLIPIQGKDPYWDYSSRDVLFGLVLLLFKICKEMELPDNLINMKNVLQLKEELFCSYKSNIIQRNRLWVYAKQDHLIRTRLNGAVICPEETLSCIISVFDQHMSCFTLQPQVVEMLSESTFDVNDFGFSKNVLFMIVPDEKSTFHKIITVFLKQVYELLIGNAFKKTKNNRFPSRVNFILDEFSSLPMISDFSQMISASRSRNIRFLLVMQSKHQLQRHYAEETDTIMSNCANWMFLTSREIELLREVSELSGRTGANKEPLISISKLQHLDKDIGECLIFSGRKHPYIAKLPDIDVYDKGNYKQAYLAKRKTSTKPDLPIDFFSTRIQEILPNNRPEVDVKW